ncbi:hypothetical protein C8J57DRAFT_1614020 [Mycena rebaudengoi]|nr:hypothetical protein C8J57DRAFT_1614020 [Mycena rebaudengoi]
MLLAYAAEGCMASSPLLSVTTPYPCGVGCMSWRGWAVALSIVRGGGGGEGVLRYGGRGRAHLESYAWPTHLRFSASSSCVTCEGRAGGAVGRTRASVLRVGALRADLGRTWVSACWGGAAMHVMVHLVSACGVRWAWSMRVGEQEIYGVPPMRSKPCPLSIAWSRWSAGAGRTQNACVIAGPWGGKFADTPSRGVAHRGHMLRPTSRGAGCAGCAGWGGAAQLLWCGAHYPSQELYQDGAPRLDLNAEEAKGVVSGTARREARGSLRGGGGGSPSVRANGSAASEVKQTQSRRALGIERTGVIEARRRSGVHGGNGGIKVMASGV